MATIRNRFVINALKAHLIFCQTASELMAELREPYVIWSRRIKFRLKRSLEPYAALGIVVTHHLCTGMKMVVLE